MRAAMIRSYVAIVALATVAAAPLPSARDIDALRRAGKNTEACPPMRALKCAVAGDPSEYRCAYQERWKGKWTKQIAMIGRDGDTFIWLDGGPRCSSLPQR